MRLSVLSTNTPKDRKLIDVFISYSQAFFDKNSKPYLKLNLFTANLFLAIETL